MRRTILVFASLSITLFVTISTSQAEICKGLVQAVGSKSPVKAQAMTSSGQQWKVKVRATYGAAFAIWQNAKRQRVMCYNVAAPSAPPMHQCKAMARPCGTLTINPDLNGALD
jgi:hypothetical protein